MKHVELYGASSWIGVLGGVVTFGMIVGLGSISASPSAALAVLGSYDSLNTTHKILSALNIFTFWQTAVVGIGLSKFSGKSIVAGISVSAVLWILWTVISLALGFAR
jgi:hypothetical protein